MACRRSAVRSRLAPPRLHGNRAASPGSPVTTSPSSRGLGHYPFTVATGVRIPVGTPPKQPGSGRVSFCPDFAIGGQTCRPVERLSKAGRVRTCSVQLGLAAHRVTHTRGFRGKVGSRGARTHEEVHKSSHQHAGSAKRTPSPSTSEHEVWSGFSVEHPIHGPRVQRSAAAVTWPPCRSAPSCYACSCAWRSP